MTPSLRRRLGAALSTSGLVVATLGFAFTGAPAGAAGAPTTSSICNQQRSTTPNDNCEGDKFHGTLTTSFDDDGALVFDIAAADGFVGWNAIKICIPQVGPTDSADCTGNDGPLSPQDYEVTGATGVVEEDKEIRFDCDRELQATVAPAAFAGTDEPTYTVHLTVCGGGTDESFGTAVRAMAATTTTTDTTAPTTTTSPTTTTTEGTTPTTAGTTPTTAGTTPTTAGRAPTGTANPPSGGTETRVLDNVLQAPPAAAAAVAVAPATTAGAAAAAPAQLARTGAPSDTLVPLGLGLVLAGALAVLSARRRPELAPLVAGSRSPMASTGPTTTAAKRPLLILGALLLAGIVLPRSAGKHLR